MGESARCCVLILISQLIVPSFLAHLKYVKAFSSYRSILLGLVSCEGSFCRSCFIDAQRLVQFWQVFDLAVAVNDLDDLDVAVVLGVTVERLPFKYSLVPLFPASLVPDVLHVEVLIVLGTQILLFQELNVLLFFILVEVCKGF